jgi:hypothetical protein
MPHKTKRAKMLAETRRKPVNPAVYSDSVMPKEPDRQSSQTQPYTFMSAKLAPRPQTDTIGVNELTAIKKDLVKSFIFSACAIGIELLLYVRLEVLAK